jgi:predicted metalloprotease with PDZ domain
MRRRHQFKPWEASMLRFRCLTAQLVHTLAVFAFAGALCAWAAGVPTPTAEFTVHDINPSAKTLRVSCTLSGLAPGQTTKLTFADSWGPASNLSSRIRQLKIASLAADEIEHTKSDKAGYTFVAPADGAAVVTYTLNLSDKRSRIDYPNCDSLDDHKLILFGTTAFFSLGESGPAQTTVAIEPPPGWQITTGADILPDGSYDLADTQDGVFLVADFAGRHFSVGGIDCIVAVDHEFLIPPPLAQQWVTEIVARHKAVWGGYPVGRLLVVMGNYPFAVGGTTLGGQYIGGAVIFFGGAEEAARDSEDTPTAFYKTVAHELFHVGNPAMLRPSDAESEIWWAEGATEYMAFKTVLADQKMTPEDFLEKIAKTYADSTTSTYVRDLSLADAAKARFDSGEMVYGKGMLAAMVIDLALRNNGGRIASIEALFSEIARRGRFGADPDQPTLMEYLGEAGVADLAHSLIKEKGMDEITAGLAQYGLKVEKAKKAYLGFSLKAGCEIEKVLPETAAQKAGLRPGDIILAIDGRELNDFTELKKVIDSLKVGQLIELAIEREGAESSVPLIVGERDDSKLVRDDGAPDRVKAVLAAWLTGR